MVSWASARANYLAQDRFDLAFAAKELCRRMVVPRKSDLVALRRLVRYVLEVPPPAGPVLPVAGAYPRVRGLH